MTNGESIRNMTDEQMLETFCGLLYGDPQEAYTVNIMLNETVQAPNGMQLINQRAVRMLDWLKEEAK